MRYFFLPPSIFLLFCFSSSSGQSLAVNRDGYRLDAIRTTNPIEVDGILDEAIWQNAGRAKQFAEYSPLIQGMPVRRLR